MYYSKNTLKYTFISKSIRYWKVEFPRNCSNVNIHCSFGFFPCFFIRACMNTDKVTLSRCNNCKLHSNGSHHHFILWLTNDKLICYATEPMQIVIWKIMIEILKEWFTANKILNDRSLQNSQNLIESEYLTPGSWSNLRLKSKLVNCYIVLLVNTPIKWNAFKMCLYIMLIIQILSVTLWQIIILQMTEI